MKQLLTDQIKKGEINNNISGLKYTLKQGCEPSLFITLVKELEKKKIIKRCGEVNNSAFKIHRVKKYNIEVIN